MVRIVALLMALMLFAGIFIGILSIFARAADETALVAIAATGDQGMTKWPIYVGLAAVLIVIVCVVVPKMTKKK